MASPRRETVNGLSPGDVLRVTLEDVYGASVVVARTRSGKVVGSIGGQYLDYLLPCLDRGEVDYRAEIRSIEEGEVIVEVSAASE